MKSGTKAGNIYICMYHIPSCCMVSVTPTCTHVGVDNMAEAVLIPHIYMWSDSVLVVWNEVKSS